MWHRGHMESPADSTPEGGIVLAVMNGGPIDGRIYAAEPKVNELLVTMADRSRHRYERTREFGHLPDGGQGPVFRWSGRY
jgi:hypothetical protein